MTTQDLRDQRAAAWAQAVEFRTRSEAGEDMSGEDETAWTRALDDVDRLGELIATRERDEKLQGEFDTIDERTSQPINADGKPAERDRYEDAFGTYLRSGASALNAEQRSLLIANMDPETRAQSVGTNSAGGYTVPQGFWAKVVETMKWYGGMLQVAEIIDTDNGITLPFPTNDDTSNVGALLSENTQISAQDLAFGQKSLSAYTYTSKLILASLQFLQDTGIDAEGFIVKKIGQRLGRIFNTHYTTGTGSGQPQGFTVGASTGKTTASSSAIVYGELIDLIHSVDAAYRVGTASNIRPQNGAGSEADASTCFMMHDLILAAVRKLTDSQNRPLWQPAIAYGYPDTLLGYPVVINNDMASTLVTTNKTMAFGDFDSHYVIRRVAGGQLMRLEERYADYLQVGFFAFGRTDALVQDASAVKLLVQV